MKRGLFFALSAAAMLASCTSDSIESDGLSNSTDSSTPKSVSFVSIIGSMSRASGNSFETDDAISVFAYDDSEAQYASNVKYSLNETSQLFESDDPIQSTGDDLSYVAIYPYNEDADMDSMTHSIAADQSDYDDYEAADMLVANVSSTSSTNPALVFYHKMSGLVVTLSGDDVDEIASAVVTFNAATSVECDVLDGTYSATGELSTITPYATSSSSYKAIVAPQSFAAGTPIITIATSADTYTWSPNETTEFVSGKQYSVAFSISETEGVTFDQLTDIEDWEEGDAVDGTVAGSVQYTLSQIDAANVPTENTWIITDETPATSEFAGFSAAIASLSGGGREISVVFPNLTALPDGVIFGSSSVPDTFPYDALVSVSAPEALTAGKNVFRNCTSLTTLSIPKVTTINTYAFAYNSALTSIDISAATTIGGNAFVSSTSLTSVSSSTVTFIDYSAFRYSSQLATAYFPKAVTFGSNIFGGCALTSLEIATAENATLSTFESNSFGSSAELLANTLTIGVANLGSVDGAVLSGTTSESGSVSVTFGAIKVVNTDGSAYDDGVLYLSEIDAENIPTGTIWEIEDASAAASAFVGLRAALGALTTAGNTTSSIKLVFKNLTEIPNTAMNLSETGYGVLGEVSAPVATKIGNASFRYCEGLTTVSLPSVTVIGSNTFNNCTNLTSVSLATKSGVVLASAEGTPFGTTTPASNIALRIGTANSSMVSGDNKILTIATAAGGSADITFASITVEDDAE